MVYEDGLTQGCSGTIVTSRVVLRISHSGVYTKCVQKA